MECKSAGSGNGNRNSSKVNCRNTSVHRSKFMTEQPAINPYQSPGEAPEASPLMNGGVPISFQRLARDVNTLMICAGVELLSLALLAMAMLYLFPDAPNLHHRIYPLYVCVRLDAAFC